MTCGCCWLTPARSSPRAPTGWPTWPRPRAYPSPASAPPTPTRHRASCSACRRLSPAARRGRCRHPARHRSGRSCPRASHRCLTQGTRSRPADSAPSGHGNRPGSHLYAIRSIMSRKGVLACQQTSNPCSRSARCPGTAKAPSCRTTPATGTKPASSPAWTGTPSPPTSTPWTASTPTAARAYEPIERMEGHHPVRHRRGPVDQQRHLHRHRPRRDGRDRRSRPRPAQRQVGNRRSPGRRTLRLVPRPARRARRPARR